MYALCLLIWILAMLVLLVNIGIAAENNNYHSLVGWILSVFLFLALTISVRLI